MAQMDEDPASFWLRGLLRRHETALHFLHRTREEAIVTGIPFLDGHDGSGDGREGSSGPRSRESDQGDRDRALDGASGSMGLDGAPGLSRETQNSSHSSKAASAGHSSFPQLLLGSTPRPLRPGRVVEVAGPSGSGKSEILLQIAASCLVTHPQQPASSSAPKDPPANHAAPRVRRLVLFLDLDLKLDVLRLRELVQARVRAQHPRGLVAGVEEVLVEGCLSRMRVFRCSSSITLIATLKAVEAAVQREREAHPETVPVLLIDSIGAFYWADRAIIRDPRQRTGFGAALPLSVSSEAVSRLLRSLVLQHRALVVAAKGLLFPLHPRQEPGARESSDAPREGQVQEGQTLHATWLDTNSVDPGLRWREHMPRAWQDLVDQVLVLS